jgi:hypothetical protein
MVPDVAKKMGSDTRGLIGYLYSVGRHDKHEDPHLVAAWIERGVPDPGRDPHTSLTDLAQLLDVPLERVRAEGHPPKGGWVWHCPVAIAPTDRLLSDAEWGEVARRIMHATGIAPDGDTAACRWIAVRHDERHIHLMATLVREDGRAPRRHKDAIHAQAECRKLEIELGLRRLKSGDRTASRRPSGAEVHKAQQHQWTEPSSSWLETQLRDALANSTAPEAFFDLLEGPLGVNVHKVRMPSGDLRGYKVGRPGDTNAEGKQIWYAAGDLARDLSWPQVQARLAANPTPEEHPARRARPEHPLIAYTAALDDLYVPALQDADSGTGGDGGAQAYIAAFHESVILLAPRVPAELRQQLRQAERVLARANRSQVKADHAATRQFRAATRELLYQATTSDDAGGTALAIALGAIVFAVLLAEQWHTRRGHQQQADAVHHALADLRAVADQAARQPLTDLAERAPTRGVQADLARDLTTALPDRAQQITADPAWPALAAALADAAQRGHNPRTLLQQAARQRELDTAHSPATVLALRITRIGHQPAPNRMTTAARLRSTTLPRRNGTLASASPAATIVAPPKAPDAGPRRR